MPARVVVFLSHADRGLAPARRLVCAGRGIDGRSRRRVPVRPGRTRRRRGGGRGSGRARSAAPSGTGERCLPPARLQRERRGGARRARPGRERARRRGRLADRAGMEPRRGRPLLLLTSSENIHGRRHAPARGGVPSADPRLRVAVRCRSRCSRNRSEAPSVVSNAVSPHGGPWSTCRSILLRLLLSAGGLPRWLIYPVLLLVGAGGGYYVGRKGVSFDRPAQSAPVQATAKPAPLHRTRPCRTVPQRTGIGPAGSRGRGAGPGAAGCGRERGACAASAGSGDGRLTGVAAWRPSGTARPIDLW